MARKRIAAMGISLQCTYYPGPCTKSKAPRSHGLPFNAAAFVHSCRQMGFAMMLKGGGIGAVPLYDGLSSAPFANPGIDISDFSPVANSVKLKAVS
jgi:hypothetical protein